MDDDELEENIKKVSLDKHRNTGPNVIRKSFFLTSTKKNKPDLYNTRKSIDRCNTRKSVDLCSINNIQDVSNKRKSVKFDTLI